MISYDLCGFPPKPLSGDKIEHFVGLMSSQVTRYSTGNADPVLARVTATVFLLFPRYTIAVFDCGIDCYRDDTATG